MATAAVAAVPERVAALGLLSTDGVGRKAVLAEPSDSARLTDHTGSPREQASRLIDLLFPPDVAAEVDRAFGDVVAEARARLSPATVRAQEAAIVGA